MARRPRRNNANDLTRQIEAAFGLSSSMLRGSAEDMLMAAAYQQAVAKGRARAPREQKATPASSPTPAPNDEGFIVINNIKFRSQSEVKIAEALGRAGAFYIANGLACLNGANGRVQKEPDFLICHKGKWGILEVDGEEYHQNAAKDHDRDRLFQKHGIRVVSHYDAERCYNQPDEVVRDFLSLLESCG